MSLFDELFSFTELQRVLSDEARIHAMLQFEAALAKAEARAGIVPEDAANRIADCCATDPFDLSTITKQAAKSGNLAIPLVKLLTEAVAKQDAGASRFVHWGATSQDAIDTGMVLQLRDALKLVEKDLARLMDTVAALATEHRATPIVARSWMQQAMPTTFGFIVAGWLDALVRHRQRLSESRARVFCLQFGGAVGTLAALGAQGAEVSKELAKELHLSLPMAPWHTHRDRVAEAAAFLGLLAGTLGKIARDISLHSQTEVGELSEPTGEGRGSSSTMPHKSNPVTCAIVLDAAARVPGLVATMLSAMPQEYERGLGGWHAEWETLPEIVRLTAGALHHLAEMLPHLQVDKERMRQNLETTRGLIFAEAVSMALAERIGKMAGHKFVEAATQRARDEQRHLKDVLREDAELRNHLSIEELDGLFEARNYLGNAENFVQQVVVQARSLTPQS
jgi:3-carboxy-cis,cis-muconate cycloisomerase